jgi:hypothetical protein
MGIDVMMKGTASGLESGNNCGARAGVLSMGDHGMAG